MNTKLIMVDLDDVVFDFNGYIDKRFGRRHHKLNLKETYPEYSEEIDDLLKDPQVYLDLDYFVDSKYVIWRLTEAGFDVDAVTSRPYSKEMKISTYNSIRESYIPIRYVHFANPKTDVILKYQPMLYVDDMPRHIIPLLNTGIKLYLFDQEYNRDFYNKKVKRVMSLSEMVADFDPIGGLYDRDTKTLRQFGR